VDFVRVFFFNTSNIYFHFPLILYLFPTDTFHDVHSALVCISLPPSDNPLLFPPFGENGGAKYRIYLCI